MNDAQIAGQLSMDQAWNAADLDWLTAAREILRTLVEDGAPFTSEDVWALLELRGVSTPEPRALGALFKSAAQAGAIRRVGWVTGTRVVAHGRPVAQWVRCG